MRTIHLWPDEERCRQGMIRRVLTIEESGKARRSLWYGVSENHKDHLPADCDHLVIGSVFMLMQTGLNAHVHGQVSPSLLRNLTEFQAAWVATDKNLISVDITADQEVEASPDPARNGALVAFSGGVDSCFTAYRHARGVGLRFPYELAGAVMAQGFDIPLEDPSAFRRAVDRSRRMVSSLDLELMAVETNFRDIVNDWSHSHGTAIASCLALFGGGFRTGLIGQTYTYPELRHIAEGVNALTDPMLSSDAFKIVPDGAAFERADKIRPLGNWDEFLQDLRVCWEGPKKDRNCCVCEKCIRNILTFRALGLGLPPCFEHDVTDEQIRKLKPGRGIRPGLRYGQLGELAAASGSSGPWVRAVEQRLLRDRHSQLLRRVVGKFRRLPGLFRSLWARVGG